MHTLQINIELKGLIFIHFDELQTFINFQVKKIRIKFQMKTLKNKIVGVSSILYMEGILLVCQSINNVGSAGSQWSMNIVLQIIQSMICKWLYTEANHNYPDDVFNV